MAMDLPRLPSCLIIIALIITGSYFLLDEQTPPLGFGLRLVNGKLYGPYLCVDRIRLHVGFDKLTEYPLGDADGGNFLSYGEACNHTSQVIFEDTLKTTYTRLVEHHEDDDVTDTELMGHTNEDLFKALDVIWNRWRAYSEQDEVGRGGICNPRRLLSCDPVGATCKCRQEFPEGKEWAWLNPRPSARTPAVRITLHEETIETFDPSRDLHEEVIMCRVKEMSSCKWEVPWLGFCHVPCAKGLSCMSTGDVTASQRCIPCDPSSQEELDKCIEAGLAIS